VTDLSAIAALESRVSVLMASNAELERENATLKTEVSRAQYRECDMSVLLKNEAANYQREAEDNAALRSKLNAIGGTETDKVMLSQALTTEAESGHRLLADIHDKLRRDILDADARAIDPLRCAPTQPPPALEAP
jgi:hypothetical protein